MTIQTAKITHTLCTQSKRRENKSEPVCLLACEMPSDETVKRILSREGSHPSIIYYLAWKDAILPYCPIVLSYPQIDQTISVRHFVEDSSVQAPNTLLSPTFPGL